MAHRRRVPDRRGTTLETLLARGALDPRQQGQRPVRTRRAVAARQLVSSAVIGHVTLADVAGRPGAWRWMLASPYRLAEPVTGVHGHPGLWLIDLPPRVSTSKNTTGSIRQPHPAARSDL